jgi:hypothetical protein
LRSLSGRIYELILSETGQAACSTRRCGQEASDNGQDQPRRLAIVEPKRKPRTMIFGEAPELMPEEHQRRGDAADALFREIVRLARD